METCAFFNPGIGGKDDRLLVEGNCGSVDKLDHNMVFLSWVAPLHSGLTVALLLTEEYVCLELAIFVSVNVLIGCIITFYSPSSGQIEFVNIGNLITATKLVDCRMVVVGILSGEKSVILDGFVAVAAKRVVDADGRGSVELAIPYFVRLPVQVPVVVHANILHLVEVNDHLLGHPQLVLP